MKAVLFCCTLFTAIGIMQAQTANPPSAPDAPQLQHEIENGAATQALDQLASMPSSDVVERLRGMAYYQLGRLNEAERSFARAVILNPNDMDAQQMRGVALYRLGRAADAIPLLESAHSSIPQVNVDGNYVLGTCYILVGRYDDARRAFAVEYGFDKDSPEAYLLLGRFLLRHGGAEAAAPSIKVVLSKAPNMPMAHLLMGEIELAAGNLPAAASDFEAEKRIDPLNAVIYDRLGDAYLRMGNLEAAQQALNRSILLEPTSTGPFIQLGELYLQQKNASMAAMYLQRASSMDTNNIAVHRLLAQAYGRQGLKQKEADEIAAAEKLQRSKNALRK